MIKLEKVNVGYKNRKVIKDFSLNFKKGEFCSLIGPNGAGKSTLLKAIAGFKEISSGTISINNTNISTLTKKTLSTLISIIPQEVILQFDYTIQDIVSMGRFPYLKYLHNYSKNDLQIIEKTLIKMELFDKRKKLFSQLSGGEKQRVSLARVLVQDTDAILLDESFANLDINHQIEIMQILSDINAENGKLIILISHNINLASDYCSRIIMIKEGQLIADGIPQNTINKKSISELYGNAVIVKPNPVTQQPNIFYPGKK